MVQQLHAAADGGQGVPKLVGEAGRQLPDGRQPLADPGAFFQGLEFGQVLEQQQLTGFLAPSAPQRGQMPAQYLKVPVSCREGELEPMLGREGVAQGEEILDG